MQPLRLCFLWHQHQPDYRTDTGFYLPWVRMHALKDYADLVEIMGDYDLRHTINVVPSLMVQLDAYRQGATDPVQRLCALAPAAMTAQDRVALMAWVRTLQRETMVRPLQRLDELFDHPDPAWMSDQEVLDVQVLLMLAWTGPIGRRHPVVAGLLEQGSGYTITQRNHLMAWQEERLASVIDVLRTFAAETGSELSTTPFHHPILPLLCTTNSALESQPELEVPAPPFQEPHDADWHIREAIADHARRFQAAPNGMWPAEGSVSNEALGRFAARGVRWVATDEEVLRHTLGVQSTPTAHLRPYTVPTDHGPIAILFRDHGLSDAIGFEYASWDPEHAAENFCTRLEERRSAIVHTWGESALEWATVSVILDGENCWEFYPGNGEDFLRALFGRLQGAPERYTTVTCSQAIDVDPAHLPELDHLVAGSWIGGTFDIWIGSPAKNAAWSLLRDLRARLRAAEDPPHLMELWYPLEASDWFWWYDERHQAPHKSEFDSAFRSRLRTVYTALGEEPGIDLQRSLLESTMNVDQTLATFPISFGNNTMHDADALVEKVTVETDGNWQRMTFHFQRDCRETEEVIATITDRHGAERRVGMMCDQVLFQSGRHDEGFERRRPRQVSLYLHSTTHWFVGVEEQRASGRTARASVEILL